MYFALEFHLRNNLQKTFLVNMDMKKMMRQVQDMATKAKKIQDDLSSRKYDGVSGGGLVNIGMDGSFNMLEIKIADSVMRLEEKEMLEDLIIAAFSNAKSKILKDAEESNKALGPLNNMMPKF